MDTGFFETLSRIMESARSGSDDLTRCKKTDDSALTSSIVL